MLDIKIIRENSAIVKKDLKKRKDKESLKVLEEVIGLDEKWRNLKHKEDELRSSRNKLSKNINEVKKSGGDVKHILEKVKNIPDQIKKSEDKRKKLEIEMILKIRLLPNLMHTSVKYGKDDSDNVEVKKWGKIRKFDFPVKNHVELIENLKMGDFEQSAKISGHGFYVLKGDLASLNQALLRFTMDVMNKKNYTYIEPPLLIHKDVLNAAMDTEGFKNTIYKIEGEDLNLIGTSEHSLLGMHAGDAIPEWELPKKYFSYTMCFRKEIGSHGINEKGLWRTHQFNKVEQFVFCKPEDSDKLYDELQKNAEEIVQMLEIPYRIMEMCTGDLALWKHRSSDIEVWRPTTKEYGEVTSLSNCTDYQARDLNIKVVFRNGERKVLHTLNNTALASSRMLVAVIENYQNKDGSITIPKVLRPYMFGKEKIKE